ncbi:DUF1345 domain-containing protein [Salinibacterium sp. ZJ450]|uniref:DUF1345 domain-containing protein n=1 Tax=Salinibacterium sp. ZJ450 TaxID=2708338 RepID=UPI001CD3076C|nr:DUF1345 domain-containing protein [Salinibacterium sp. ZJ450]
MSVALAVGVAVGLAVGFTVSWTFAPALGWVAAAIIFLSWTWLVIGRFDGAQTSRHATMEDRSRLVAEVLLLCASIASFGTIALILIEAGSVQGALKLWLVALALATIAVSWLLVTTVFTLRYAHLYYRNNPGGINFNQKESPRYTDFAYLAVTIGATFQVSDTNLETHDIRMTALRHSLLSYVLGVFVLATAINLVSGLAR